MSSGSRRIRPSAARQRSDRGVVLHVAVNGQVSALPWFAAHSGPMTAPARIRSLLGAHVVDRLDPVRVAGLDVAVWTDADAVLDGREVNLAVAVTVAMPVHGPVVVTMPGPLVPGRPVGFSTAGAGHVAAAFTDLPVTAAARPATPGADR